MLGGLLHPCVWCWLGKLKDGLNWALSLEHPCLPSPHALVYSFILFCSHEIYIDKEKIALLVPYYGGSRVWQKLGSNEDFLIDGLQMAEVLGGWGEHTASQRPRGVRFGLL